MKGPMTTQTLRGMATHGALHWRGDRVDGIFGTDSCAEASGAPCSEEFSFRNFIVAFEGLVGMQGTIDSGEMQQFTDFALSIMLPPNPIRALNNSLSTPATAGQTLFFGRNTDTIENCDGCHTLDPAQGFFGSGGEQSFEGEPQNAKVPHMRNLYHKVGMFGLSTSPTFTGEQVRGFGFLHDGSVDSVDHFLEAGVFSVTPTEELNLQAFSMEFPTDLAPIVGQQVTRTATNGAVANPRVDLLVTRASANFSSLMLGGTVKECDLIAKGSVDGVERGWVREANGQFRSDIDELIDYVTLRNSATTQGPITFTCAPPGSGIRMGINRDGDNFLDGLDNCPALANNDQLDTNNNGIGNACDPITDSDNDGVLDGIDNCPAIANPDQTDTDEDGRGDACQDLPPGC
ncbi:MAG: thrombospondin type 3 repeat-containing protein [Haliea sp.]|nr:thrombospondin type 3 repeat-containing protein [Haliea sp.]